MKRTIRALLLLLSAVMIYSCSYDDSYLRGEVDKLKTQVNEMNTQISSMKSIVEALNKGKVITALKELPEHKGYVISFSDGSSIEILNGKDAAVIGVKEEAGKYYWTITTDGNTDFIKTKDGKKIPVTGNDGKDGKDGHTPVLAVDSEGFWTVDGERLTDANGEPIVAKGDSFFTAVKENDDEVTFVMKDGSTISIPKAKETYLLFEEGGNIISKSFSSEVGYQFNYITKNIGKLEAVDVPEGWVVFIHHHNHYVYVQSPQSNEYGDYEIRIRGFDKDGREFKLVIKATLNPGRGIIKKNGVIILNEGNMTTENGFITYIDENDKLYNHLFYTVNGSELGNVTQDLTFYNGKVYIVSQNGPMYITVADAKTLQLEKEYGEETLPITKSSWPTHIAVLNEKNIFIRDKSGLARFNSVDNSYTPIEGSERTAKDRMAVSNNQVYAIKSDKLLVLKAGDSKVTKTIDFEGKITGIESSTRDKNTLWVAYQTGRGQDKKSYIAKLNSVSNSVVDKHLIEIGAVGRGFISTPAITTKNDTIYYNDAKTTIYRHIFGENTTKEICDVASMVSDAGIVYNHIAVHPETGRIYMNTVKGWGPAFLINNISVIDVEASTPKLYINYRNIHHFAAGIFFPSRYEGFDATPQP